MGGDRFGYSELVSEQTMAREKEWNMYSRRKQRKRIREDRDGEDESR
jgi:hypothetical protein